MKVLLVCICLVLAGCKKSETVTEVVNEIPSDPAPDENAPLSFSCAANALTTFTPNRVEGNDNRPAYPIEDTFDLNTSTFMTTTELSMNDTVYISYRFADYVDIESIDIVDDYTNIYALGNLRVLVSYNSTNGVNGDWVEATTRDNTNNGFTNGDGTINVNYCDVKWLKLEMTYTGTGAYGGSPSFYLSEITFNGE